MDITSADAGRCGDRRIYRKHCIECAGTGLDWLNYGQAFGLENPLVLSMGLVVLTFGLTIKITIAGIIGIALAILIYRWI